MARKRAECRRAEHVVFMWGGNKPQLPRLQSYLTASAGKEKALWNSRAGQSWVMWVGSKGKVWALASFPHAEWDLLFGSNPFSSSWSAKNVKYWASFLPLRHLSGVDISLFLPGKTVGQHLNVLNVELSCDTAIPLLGTCPRETNTYVHTTFTHECS